MGLRMWETGWPKVNIELYSVSSQKATITGAAVTLVKPGEEAPIGWADPYTLRQFGVKVVIAGEDSLVTVGGSFAFFGSPRKPIQPKPFKSLKHE